LNRCVEERFTAINTYNKIQSNVIDNVTFHVIPRSYLTTVVPIMLHNMKEIDKT